jgi:hypothetical protein
VLIGGFLAAAGCGGLAAEEASDRDPGLPDRALFIATGEVAESSLSKSLLHDEPRERLVEVGRHLSISYLSVKRSALFNAISIPVDILAKIDARPRQLSRRGRAKKVRCLADRP